MAPFLHVGVFPPMNVVLDPVTQTARRTTVDGVAVESKHRKSGTNRETRTARCKGDGGDHRSYDQDTDQEGDED